MNGNKLDVWVEKSLLNEWEKMEIRIYKGTSLYDKETKKTYYQFTKSYDEIRNNKERYYNIYNRYNINKYIK